MPNDNNNNNNNNSHNKMAPKCLLMEGVFVETNLDLGRLIKFQDRHMPMNIWLALIELGLLLK